MSNRAAPVGSGRVDWEALLPRLRELIAEADEVPTTAELFWALVEEGLAEPEHKIRFYNAATRFRNRGLLPPETRRESGIKPGTPWSKRREQAESRVHRYRPGSLELVDARRAACREYLGQALADRGRLDLTPRIMARLRDHEEGWGAELVAEAIAELTRSGRAILGQANNILILVAR